ncbi:ABC transporter G family member 5-like [Phoenix dactylifera]|uniref:ABC transporter G family member 5-like n=1 Tax=Phoenix dactylifera TaxID=42345 RepID=A0A8B9AZW3_PHODC|nr:ABC transporter G family member 5-like [Phoenix dactylifera]
MMKGCEIEARGISYEIHISERTHPFKIWSREEEDSEASHHGHRPCNLEVLPTTKSSKLRVRQVLKNVSCRAKPWEILAIVGPSGAGKSTLLEILAGKLTPPSPQTILINRKVVDKSDLRKISGYVTQKDTLYPLLTVRETLMFSARLRLGGSLPPSQLSSRVESLLRELGLGSVADARVGDAGGRVRGVSGGERRRVSIGVDAVHDPRVLILDEPTSGLDSTSATQIVDMLKTMAESRGRTVILSIHQPGSRIVKLFGSVLLLAHGSVLHQGTVDQLSSHLRSLSLQVPLQVNVVEFAIDSIDALQQHKRQETLVEHHQQQQQDQREAQEQPLLQLPKKGEGIEGKKDRCTLQQLFQLHKVVDEESLAGFDFSYDYPNSRFQEVTILTHRFLNNVFRTKELFACRTIQMLVSGLVLGSIFFDLKDDKVLERVGLFAFVLTFLLSCTTEALPIFLQEREILMKETSSGSYRVSSYVVANGLVFLPFLFILAILFSVPLYWLVGLNRSFTAFMYFLLLIWLILYTANSVVVCFSALAPNFIVGNSLISGVMGSFFLFSGYFIRKKAMPSYWVFMHFISLFKYPFESFLVNEFSGPGMCVKHEMGLCVLRGEDLLREEGLGEESRWRNVVVMVCFILAYRFFSYLILMCRCRCVQKGGLKRALV